MPDVNEHDLMTDEGLFVFRCGKKRLPCISNEIPCSFSCLSDYCGAAATLKLWFYAKIHFAPQKQDKSNLYFLCLLHFSGGFSNSLLEHSEASLMPLTGWWRCPAVCSALCDSVSLSLLGRWNWAYWLLLFLFFTDMAFSAKIQMKNKIK